METLQRILGWIAAAFRYWVADVGKRKSCAGKGCSLSIGLFIILMACAIPMSILSATGRAVGLLPTLTPIPSATPIPSSTPTSTPAPTATPLPTSTPRPTFEPAAQTAVAVAMEQTAVAVAMEQTSAAVAATAAAAPVPAPSCSNILAAKQQMTDVQWNNFKDSVRDTWLNDVQAKVREVGDRSFLAGGYPVYIEISSDCDIYYVAPDEQTAVKFSKGQQVNVSAQVKFIDSGLFGGITYYLEESTAVIR